MEWDLDMGGKTPEQIEETAGNIPNGWYRARLADVAEDTKNGGLKLTFTILGPKCAGRPFTERVGDPKYARNAEAAPKIAERLNLVAVRLGAVTQGADGKAKFNPGVAIGKEFAIQVQSRTWEKDDGTEGTFTGLSYAGLFTLDHPKLPAKARADLGLTPAAKGAAGPTSANPTPGGATGGNAPPADVNAAVSALWGK